MSKEAKGFTLIELLVTLTIVGILAAVAYPSYQAHVARSNMIEARLVLESWASLQAQARLKTGRFLPLNDDTCRRWWSAQWRCPPNFVSNYPKSRPSVRTGAQGMITTLTVVLLMSVSLFILLGPFALAKTTWLLSQG